MKDLITGGAGFIGSHLAERLIADGDEVYVIDDLSTGSIENLDSIRDNERFHYVIDSIENESALVELIDRCDVIYHLAAAVGVKLIVKNPVKTIETNIHGTELILRLANKKKKKVVLASSSEVYGKGTKQRFREDDDMLLGPTMKARWCYACSKAIDEFLGLAYWSEAGLPVLIVRFFNIVGPRQVGDYGMVLPNFVKQALAGGPIIVYDDGQQTRSFTYVGDAIEAIVRLAREEKALGEVFNIGSGEEITVLGLAETIRDKVNPNIEITYVPYETIYGEGFEDIRYRVPDVTKLKEAVDFKPSVSLDQIVDNVIAYFSRR